MRLEELDLSCRTYNILKFAGIDTVEQLQATPIDELEKLRHMVPKCLKEIEAKLLLLTQPEVWSNKVRLIDATPIKKFIVDRLNSKDPAKAFGHDAIEILAEIEYAPTIDPESLRPKGRWEHPNGYAVTNGFGCSECGQEEISYRAINPRPGGACLADENGNFYYPPKMNYCPNCGAKMEG